MFNSNVSVADSKMCTILLLFLVQVVQSCNANYQSSTYSSGTRNSELYSQGHSVAFHGVIAMRIQHNISSRPSSARKIYTFTYFNYSCMSRHQCTLLLLMMQVEMHWGQFFSIIENIQTTETSNS